MVDDDRAHIFGRGQGFLQTIRGVSRIIQQSSIPIRGLALAIMSVILGFLADQASQKNADRRWLETYSPSFEVWTMAVERAGLQKVRNPKAVREIAASLPPLGMDLLPSEVYWSASPLLVVIREIRGDSGESILMASANNLSLSLDSLQAVQWEFLGASWPGWEAMTARLKNTHIPRWATPPKPLRSWSDSREIQY